MLNARLFLVVPAALILLLGAQAVPLRLIVVESASEADTLAAQLRNGGDFSVMAREKSTDPTATDGGFLGNMDPATLREELRGALQGLLPGQISKPVRLPAGFAILQIVPPAEAAKMAETQRARQLQFSAEGSIPFSFDISGLNEAQSALASFPKPADWYEDLNGACRIRRQSLAAVNARADKLLEPATDAENWIQRPFDAMSVRVAKGQLYAYTGAMGQAIEQWEIASRRASNGLPRAFPYLDELLGIGYLHKSQMENGSFRNPQDKCLFPMSPAARYSNTADSQKSIEYLLKALKQKPADLEARWLLSIAYMTLGTYPAGVPKEYLIPPSAFASSEDIGRFRDVAAGAGLNIFGMAGGLIVDDFDNDGLLDVVTSSFDMCVPMRFHHNNGDGTFTDRSAKAGFSGQLGGLNMIQADYNNDGCMDILVLRGGWEIPQRRSLLRNNCNGTFTDVTKESGLGGAASSQTAVWADIDNDGFVDLFVGNENGPNQLFRNNGDGTFRNVSHTAGVDLTAFTKGVAAADYDNDGYVDLYVSNYRGDNALYHNNHNVTFTEISKQAGVPGTGHGFAAWFFDYDNDGLPDLFATSYHMSTDETVRTYLGLPHNGGTMKLYRNLGTGAFEDVTARVGLDKVFMPMGANFGDIDNDGYLDIYLGTGNPSYSSLVPNVLLHNKAGRSFVDITASSGTGELHKGHGVAFADIDNDGDEDILTVIGGATPGDSHVFRLFENPGNGNDWIGIRLIGARANRAAIGARIKVTVSDEGQPARAIYRTVSSGGSFGASPLEQHVGLGKSARIESIEIGWPGASIPQTLFNVEKNQAIAVKQDTQGYTRLARHPVRLGGGAR